MKETYEKLTFRRDSLLLINSINNIISEYKAQGYVLTVRQLYYQLVSRDVISNNEKSYKKIVDIVRDGRLAGLIDWSMIEDRTREFTFPNVWESGSSILKGCANQFHMDRWKTQGAKVFCIIEKEALVSVLQRVCTEYDIPLLAARGYPSSTVVRDFGKYHLIPAHREEKRVIILHLGDHDPSGIDMSRDLEDRLALFSRNSEFEFRRIALNYEQVLEVKPPPNPAKATDSRFADYKNKFGDESWELDALSPKYLTGLVRSQVEGVIDPKLWEVEEAKIASVKDELSKLAENFDES